MTSELTPIQRRLAAALEGAGRVIVRLEQIERLFTEVRPATSEHADRRRALAADLKQLADHERLQLPRAPDGWDRTATPPLPRFVSVRPAAPDKRPTRRVAGHTVGWRPQLAWAAGARHWSARRLGDLIAINRFLGQAPDRPVVPLRERSVELFGDEKRLGTLLADERLFAPDRLTLELLRARRTSPPFISQSVDDTRADGLIVENWDTFETLSALGPAVGRVLYGAGAHVTAALPSLLDDPPGELRYFGDLDAAGLAIAARATARSAELGLPPVAPDAELYQLLLEHGSPQQDLSARRLQPEAIAELSAWLGDEDLQAAASVLLASGARLAQEQVGVELLTALRLTR